MSAAAYRSNLDEARILLSEGLLRLWEQADLIDALLVAGKPTEKAKDLLLSMQKTVDDLVRQIKSIVDKAN
jgi:hypothetical protein